MANGNIKVGPNGGICTETTSFQDAGITPSNINLITEIGVPFRTHDPKESFNTLSQFTKNGQYQIDAKVSLDWSDFMLTEAPEDYIPPVVTSAYQINGAAQNISVTNPATFSAPTGPISIGLTARIAANSYIALGSSSTTNRYWDVIFSNGEGGSSVYAGIQVGNDSNNFINQQSSLKALNVDYVFWFTFDGVNDLDVYTDGALDNGASTSQGSFTAIGGGGTFNIGKLLSSVQSSGCIISDFIWVNKKLSLSEVQQHFNGGTPLDPTTTTFAANVVTYLPLASNLLDTKNAHNGLATSPIFV